MGVFNKTIIPLVLVGYEMIIANSALRAVNDFGKKKTLQCR